MKRNSQDIQHKRSLKPLTSEGSSFILIKGETSEKRDIKKPKETQQRKIIDREERKAFIIFKRCYRIPVRFLKIGDQNRETFLVSDR